MSHLIKWHVSPRVNNAIEHIADMKYMLLRLIFCVKFIKQKPSNSVGTQYVYEKSENARVCAK